MTGNGSAQNERRVHHEAREIFEQACVLLAPYIQEDGKGFHMSNFGLTHVVSEHFPSLPRQQVSIVVAAVENYYRNKRHLKPGGKFQVLSRNTIAKLGRLIASFWKI